MKSDISQTVFIKQLSEFVTYKIGLQQHSHTKAYALLFRNKSKYKEIKVALAEMLYREFNSDR